MSKNETYELLNCDLDRANCAEVTRALSEYGDGDMKNGVRNLSDDCFNKGKSKGIVEGAATAVVSFFAFKAITFITDKAMGWYHDRQEQKEKALKLHEAFERSKHIAESNENEDENLENSLEESVK
ncbi:hypothetical protein [uncultured Holdemanella sp.]|uniref:hypothetical protein n=1 Tax=uncultured Holdemanella sp. TaxID=1763549 RepID=UPI0025E027EE|nr:hypothetical protein [uncultured Holdemanella sp.]